MHQKLLFWGHKNDFFLGRGHSPLPIPLPCASLPRRLAPFQNPKYATVQTVSRLLTLSE